MITCHVIQHDLNTNLFTPHIWRHPQAIPNGVNQWIVLLLHNVLSFPDPASSIFISIYYWFRNTEGEGYTREQNEICTLCLWRTRQLTFQLALEVCPNHHFLVHLGSEIVLQTARQIKENTIKKSLPQLHNVITEWALIPRPIRSLIHIARIIAANPGIAIPKSQVRHHISCPNFLPCASSDQIQHSVINRA